MEIEINVTYVISKRVQVPDELAYDEGVCEYPNRERFDEFVAEQADALLKEHPVTGEDWVSTDAYETEYWNEVYSIG